MTNLIWNGQTIEQREADGMVNLTAMAKANNVNVNDWAKTDAAKRYIWELASITKILVVDLMISKAGNPENGGGTWAHPLLAIEFGRWVSPAFAIWCDQHIQRLVQTGKTELDADRQHLEVSAAPKPKLSEIKQATKMYESRYGKAYGDRYHDQMMAKHYPALVGAQAAPEEKAPLPTTKALLNPTQIAERLGWWCKSNASKGDARKVNQQLAFLGYQEQIAGQWSATAKAVSANLADRVPVDTGSKTQKDQLRWSADIVAILQEHTIPA